MHALRLLLGLLCFAAVSSSVLAQAYPSRALTLIVPSSPGSAPDVMGRLLGMGLSEQLGQQVLVVNRPGASGNIGSEAVVKAAPDGYTLLLGSIVNSVNPHLMKVNFTLEDLAPVSSAAAAPDVLTVHPSFAATNAQELIQYLRANPNTAVGFPGLGSTPHLSSVTLRMMTGIQLTLVPYQGGGQVMQGLLSQQVPVAFVTTLGVIPRLKSGQLRGLAISSPKRSAALPDIPTMAELGLPGFAVTAWFGVFAPAATPRELVDRISLATRKALASPAVHSRLVELGADPLGSTPEEFKSFVQAEYAKWGKLVKEAGIKAE